MGALISILWGYYQWLFAAQNTISSKTTSEKSIEGVVAKLSDLKDGEITECTLGDGKVLVIKDGAEVFAIGTKCSHLNAPLKGGAYYKGRIRCPLHGACFNTKTGDIEDFPASDCIPSYNVKIHNNDVIVRAPPSLLTTQVVSKPAVRQTSPSPVYVIIGGGPAGGTAAATLRQEGFGGQIILINREKWLPYDRTKLSKVMRSPIDSIVLKGEDFFKKHDIQLKLGTEVAELDSDAKTIKLKDGSIISYNKCLIATGADPQRLPFIKGWNSKNVFVLRTVEQAHEIDQFSPGKKVVIVGSSFIGMEVAACISKTAKEVIVIGMEKVPFERVLGAEVGAVMQKIHEANGIKLIMNAICDEFVAGNGDDIVTSVRLKSGEVIDNVDMLVIGAGVVPATSFIKPSPNIKIDKDKSIIVDQYLRADGSNGSLYAAGDLARYPFPMLNGELVRIEHWGMAQIQGSIAAKNMMFDNPRHAVTNIPYFWTVQYGKSLRYCGHALHYDSVIFDSQAEATSSSATSQDPRQIKFVAYYIDKDKLLACCSFNRDPITSRVAELFNAGITITGSEILAAIKNQGSADALIKSKLGAEKI